MSSARPSTSRSAAPWATGLHQVDNPVFDREGNLFVTYSGSRGQEAPVSIFRVTRAGTREPFVSGIVNPTSMAIGPDGRLYVSSRFEGAVYRVNADGTHERIASDLGVACGLAFDADGSLYVGDRSGTIFRVRERHGRAVRDAAGERRGVSPRDQSRRVICSSARRRWRRTITSIASIATAAFARCSRPSAGRRDWRSPRTRASCTSSTRSPAAAACTGCPISTASRSWWRRAPALSAWRSALTASSR